MNHAKTTFFDDLNFKYFGINNDSRARTEAYPLFYGMQYVHSGPFYFSVNGNERNLFHGPAVFFTSPDAFYEYGSPEKTSRSHYFVCFNGEKVKNYIETGLFKPAEPPQTINSPERFLSDILELILLLQSPEKHGFAVLKFEYILLTLQNQEFHENAATYHQLELEQLAHRIAMAPELDWNFEEEAHRMNISRKHFIRLFHGVLGMPPGHFVLRQRLFKAAVKLIQQKDSIKTIAYECGFQNEFYFSRCFKKYMQLSPDEYRNKNLYTTGNYEPGK